MDNSLQLPCDPEAVDAFVARPTQGVLHTLQKISGDIMIVGAGGKMGPTLALMAAEGLRQVGSSAKVLAVSRFSNAAAREVLEKAGVQTVSCDLLDRDAVAKLPDAPNILFLAGQKFGTSDGPERTWAMNTIVPANVAERFSRSRIVAYSTGCVYSFASVIGGGSSEQDPTEPTGDYANSCLGRERTFEFFSKQNGTPVALYRLNYAVDFRYGVLVDIAQKVLAGEPVDVTMGHVNLIWQGDACARSIQCLEVAASPAEIVNITGPETVSVRMLAHRFGRLFNKPAIVTGQEADRVWLNNAGKSFALFGYPEVALETMIEWVGAWLKHGGATWGKPTHFEVRDGKF